MEQVIFKDLGIIGYKEAWDYQEKLLQQNVQGKSAAAAMARNKHLHHPEANEDGGAIATISPVSHYFLLCEHPPVYTLGKSGHESNVLLSQEEMDKRGIAYYHTNRGGDITFHGPGQIIGYPILDLEKYYTDIGKYLRNLEEVIILVLRHYNITGQRSPGETGVWIDPFVKGRERKICAMGVRCSRWVTMHGFALNVNTDLSYFNHIIPCGIADKQVTSIAKELGYEPDIEEVKALVQRCFEKVFESRLVNG